MEYPTLSSGNILQEIQRSPVQWKHWIYYLPNSYSDNKYTRLFSDSLRSIPEMENKFFPTDYFNLLFMKYHEILKTMLFALRRLLNKLEENRIKYYISPNSKTHRYRNYCSTIKCAQLKFT
jgi:hypothetical protein